MSEEVSSSELQERYSDRVFGNALMELWKRGLEAHTDRYGNTVIVPVTRKIKRAWPNRLRADPEGASGG